MKKLKVLFISAANSIHTVRWVNSLSEECEVHLVYCKNHKSTIDAINPEVIIHELKFSAPFGYYLNSLQLRKIYKEVNPNVVNVHFASGYGTLARRAKLDNILLSIWGSDVYDFPNKSKINRKILQKNVMHAKTIASTSYVMARKLKEQFPTLNKDIYITPFGVDTEKFKKSKLSKRDNNFNIGLVKRLEKKYGITYLIHAVKELMHKLSENNEKELANSIKLYIYGKGSQKNKLKSLIKKLNLQNNVFIMGKIANNLVPEKLNEFDVFCAPSIYNSESFGVAVVEAMSCEVPVIASDVDGFCEVMEDKKTGYIVERKNVSQITNALEILLNDKNLRIEFGQNGRKRVLEKYNWRDNVETMKEIYKSIAK